MKLVFVVLIIIGLTGCNNASIPENEYTEDGAYSSSEENNINKSDVIEEDMNMINEVDELADDIENSNTSLDNEDDISNKTQETIEYTTLEEAKCLSENEIVNVKTESIQDFFYEKEITDEIFERIYGKSYKVDCTVPREELRYVRVLFYGFDSETHIGGIIVNQKISKDIMDIFYQLYINNYEIESMTLIDEFDADDEKSMQANNTSAFNYRTIAGSSKLSNHSLGMAIDINPLYNPYVKVKSDGTTIVSPESAKDYVDREAEFEHKITSDDLCCKLFKEYGFIWGGDYNSLKDYQHFEKED